MIHLVMYRLHVENHFCTENNENHENGLQSQRENKIWSQEHNPGTQQCFVLKLSIV